MDGWTDSIVAQLQEGGALLMRLNEVGVGFDEGLGTLTHSDL